MNVKNQMLDDNDFIKRMAPECKKYRERTFPYYIGIPTDMGRKPMFVYSILNGMDTSSDETTHTQNKLKSRNSSVTRGQLTLELWTPWRGLQLGFSRSTIEERHPPTWSTQLVIHHFPDDFQRQTTKQGIIITRI